MNTFFRLDMPRVSKETRESREKMAANLKLIIKAKGLKQNAFAQEIGIDDSNLSQILGAKRTMGEDLIGRVSKKFGLSYETIKYGTNLAEALGLPASGTDRPDMSHHIAEREAIYRVDRPGEVLDWNSAGRGVPFYDVDVFAGDVVAFNDYNHQPKGYLQMPGVADCDFACRVSGNSMQDKIHPGAILVCKEITDRQIIAFGEIHLVVTKEQRLVKYLRRNKEARGRFILKSHNPDYDDIDVKAEDILRLFLVKFVINQQQL